MHEVEYKDSQGRLFKVSLPDGVPDSQARHGMIIGPPLLDELELPIVIKTRLHNELYWRGLLTGDDAQRRISEVSNAIRAALKLTTEGVLEQYG